jgi:peptide/nickel transport system substrate-binding protein
MRTKLFNVDLTRDSSTTPQNHAIDELLAGQADRRTFLRYGSVMGLSLSTMGGVLAAAGSMASTTARAASAGGGVVRVGVNAPTGAIDPLTVDETGGLVMLSQSGEFLVLSGQDLVLKPMLAESWKSNEDGTVWTFNIRKNVKFNDGQLMTADDVVATIDRLADPASASNALSVFKGVLSKGGAKKVDDYTVEFHLDAPNGNFPYSLSNDNYNAIILPKSYTGNYEATFPGTGPFKLEKYTRGVGASFLRNDDYWGPRALPDRVEFTFYADMQAMILALQGKLLDCVTQIVVAGGQSLLKNPNINVLRFPSTTHTQVHMRTDTGPFADKRVRRALALTLDREKLVKGLLWGRASLGNDSPFAPVFPSTDPSIPQRKLDLEQAKKLLGEAGAPNGFPVTLTAGKYVEIGDYAVLLQNAAKKIGIEIDIKMEEKGAYYGKAVFGQSDWLDSMLGITYYSHRGVPNVFLSAPLVSSGTWNSAHFKNNEYDRLVSQYTGALDLQSQKAIAGKIQTLLLDETPVIFSYFSDFLTPVVKNLQGVVSSAAGQIFLAGAHFT